MVSCVLVSEGQAMVVVYDDTYQFLASCVISILTAVVVVKDSVRS